MNKGKIIALLLLISFLSIGIPAFSIEKTSQTPEKHSSPKLKGNIADYKAEYINKSWWDKFGDPILSGYITQAAQYNHDLKTASLRVAEYQALVRKFIGKEFPQVTIDPTFSRQKTSNNIAMGEIVIPEYTQNTYYLPLNVNYELDLWQKNRELTIEASKVLESVRYEEKAAYISLTSAVAASYFNVLKIDKQIQLQKDIIALREKIYELTKDRNQYGLSALSDVLKVQKSLTEAKLSLIELEKQQNVFLNQLAVLTGQSTDKSSSLNRSSIDDIEIIKNPPSFIPSDIVNKRPDILKAEADLQRSRLDVNLARKDFLPDFNITGQFGFNANSLSKTFEWNSYIASIGTGLAGKLFTGGQRLASLKAKQKAYEEMLENYQQTILTSFQEVNDSLFALKSDIQKDVDNSSRYNTESDNLDLISTKYNNGTVSFLDTLQYKENILNIKKDKIQSKTDCLIDLLSLYKAVGGDLKYD